MLLKMPEGAMLVIDYLTDGGERSSRSALEYFESAQDMADILNDMNEQGYDLGFDEGFVVETKWCYLELTELMRLLEVNLRIKAIQEDFGNDE